MHSYGNKHLSYLFVVAVFCLFCSLAFAEFPDFEYHLIAHIGDKMGQSSLMDVDKDSVWVFMMRNILKTML